VSLFGDTLAVGADLESSKATGINGDQSYAGVDYQYAGAAYVFTATAGVWSQQAYLKASNTQKNAHFGSSIALVEDGLAVGSYGETSISSGVNGSQSVSSLVFDLGAVYLFKRTASAWSQQAYVKASNTNVYAPPNKASLYFGFSVALSGDLLAVGAPREESNAVGVNGNQTDTSLPYAGAAYVFRR
jgi:hypothetical protein